MKLCRALQIIDRFYNSNFSEMEVDEFQEEGLTYEFA
jgi:hypothetical protein